MIFEVGVEELDCWNGGVLKGRVELGMWFALWKNRLIVEYYRGDTGRGVANLHVVSRDE